MCVHCIRAMAGLCQVIPERQLVMPVSTTDYGTEIHLSLRLKIRYMSSKMADRKLNYWFMTSLSTRDSSGFGCIIDM